MSLKFVHGKPPFETLNSFKKKEIFAFPDDLCSFSKDIPTR